MTRFAAYIHVLLLCVSMQKVEIGVEWTIVISGVLNLIVKAILYTFGIASAFYANGWQGNSIK